LLYINHLLLSLLSRNREIRRVETGKENQ